MKKTKEKEQYRQQTFISFLLLLGELPNMIIVIILAVTTKSLIVFTDLIDSTGNLLRSVFMLFLAKKLRKDLKYEYNYGIGKVEATASMCFDMALLISIACMMFFAVRDIISPQQPDEALGWAIVFKVVCVVCDAFMFYKQRKICKGSDNLVFKAELSMRIKNLVFDSTSFIAILLAYTLRDFKPSWYFSPVVSILLAVYLVYGIVVRMRQAVNEILDKTANEETQKIVLQALATHFDKYETFESVNSRISGGVTYIDLCLGFHEEITYGQICEFIDSIGESVRGKIPNCHISVQISNNTTYGLDGQ